VIAGRVFDNYSKPPDNTSIQLVSMDPKDANPKEVNVSADGYFIIQGLKTGASYKLVARGKSGSRTVAGITQTRAPNVTVVIQVREDLVNAGTPDVPGSPALGDNGAKTGGASSQNPFSVGQGGSRTGDDVQLPAVSVPTPGSPAPISMQPSQGWVPGPSPNLASDKATTLPLMDVPNPTVKPVPAPLLIPNVEPVPKADPQLPPVSPPPGSSALDNRPPAPARVPSCVRYGSYLKDFAFYDVSGKPWEFQRDRKGKLTLIDVWRTDCAPCLRTIPTLRQLQANYYSQGLEVIGIAVEPGEPLVAGARVNAVASQFQVNYRQLVSTSARCEFCEQLRIELFPTLLLVDREGAIV
jgi:thiol-disulfide isomerase/thioredoxin